MRVTPVGRFLSSVPCSSLTPGHRLSSPGSWFSPLACYKDRDKKTNTPPLLFQEVITLLLSSVKNYVQFCSLGGGLPKDINGNSFLCNTWAYCRYINRKTTHASSFFSSRGGAGPLAWPRGSNAGPENKMQFIQKCNIWEPFFPQKIFSKLHLLCDNKWWQKNITMWQSKSPLKNNSHQINYSFDVRHNKLTTSWGAIPCCADCCHGSSCPSLSLWSLWEGACNAS